MAVGTRSYTVQTRRVSLKTRGRNQMTDLTALLQEGLEATGLREGSALAFVPGATGAIVAMEYEPGLIGDLDKALEELFPSSRNYQHNLSHGDGNGHSHLRATLLGPSLTVPFENGRLLLGTWQSIVFVDCDNRPRQRTLIFQYQGI